jgi:uncharacterized protein (TIGR02679 family)
MAGVPVLICENPSVVAAAADALGPDCAPIVCTEGMPKTAVHLLLRRLSAAGALLQFHADFDWAGVVIGNVLRARHGAKAIFMSVLDYDAAPDGPSLIGAPVMAEWDLELTRRMDERGVAVHEEQVLPVLTRMLSWRVADSRSIQAKVQLPVSGW